MDFRFAAHDPRTGEFLRIMPRPVSVQIGDTFGTRGTLVLSYAGRPEIETFLEVRAQVSFGGEWEQVGPALLRLGGSHEDTDASGMRTIEFVSREWVLGKARVGEGELALVDGKRPFYQASPGEIMRALLLEAQDRGAAQGIELGPFDAATDSAGTAWSKVATIYYSPGLPIASVLENLVDQGMCDYRMNGSTLELYEPETAMGRDLTVGDPVRIHGAVTEAPVAYTLEDLTTSALLIGEDGFEVEVANPSAPRDYGELEVTIEQGGVNSEATARTMIDAELQRGSREIREITRSQAAAHARHLPFRDYRVGDYVEALDNGRWERYRVREVQIVRDGDGWTVHTVLNDRLQELLLKLAKRTSGIVNGSRGSGGDGTPPAPAPRPGIEPAAPQGLVVDQQVYIDGGGDARGVVTAGWGAVTESVRGRAIDVGGYELWRRDNETYAPWRMVARTDGGTEATDAPVWLTRGDGSAAEYQWRVRAVAQASGREGVWSELVTLTMTQDTTPPPPPSAPVVETGYRIVSATWDGLTADGTEMPSDFARVQVYVGATESMSDARQVGSLPYPGTWNSETMPAGVQVWVAFTAVDRVGNESAMTAAVPVTPQALVDEESIRAELDTIPGVIDGAVDDLRDDLEKVITDSAGNVITWSPAQPAEGKEGDTWFETSGPEIIGHHGYESGAWVERQITDETIASLNAGKINAGYLDAARIDANTITGEKLLIGSFENMISDVVAKSGETAPHEVGLGGATLTTQSASADAQGVNPGPHLYGITESGSADTYYQLLDFGGHDGTTRIPVESERSYNLSALIRAGGSYPSGMPYVQWSLYEYDASGTSLGITALFDSNLLLSWTWRELNGTFTTQAGATHVRVMLRVYQPDSGVRIAYPTLRPQVRGTLIEDGAITTDKILANAITAGKIDALAIRAGHIASNAVEADTIAGGAIDGKIITGATVRTSATGARVQLNANGLYAYNASGSLTSSISAQTGAVDLTGNITQRNSYGAAIFGPQPYAESTSSPGLSFNVPGYNWWGPGGLYARDDGSAGFPVTRLQGFANGEWDGSSMSLAPGGTSTGAATYFRRAHSTGHMSILGLEADRRIFLETDSADILVRSRNSSNTATNSGLYLRQNGEADLSGTNGNRVRANASGITMNGVIGRTITGPQSQMVVGNGGIIGVDGSSRRWKSSIEHVDPATYEDGLLEIDYASWLSRDDVRLAAEFKAWRAENPMCPTPPEYGYVDEEPLRQYGVIAEEVHATGVPGLVGYGEDGEPETVNRANFGIALIPIVKRLRDRVAELEARIGESNG